MVGVVEELRHRGEKDSRARAAELLDDEQQEKVVTELREQVERDSVFWGGVLGGVGWVMVLVQLYLKFFKLPGALPWSLIAAACLSFALTGTFAFREFHAFAIAPWSVRVLIVKCVSIIPFGLALLSGLNAEFLVFYALSFGHVALVWYAASMSLQSARDLQDLQRLRYNLKSA